MRVSWEQRITTRVAIKTANFEKLRMQFAGDTWKSYIYICVARHQEYLDFCFLTINHKNDIDLSVYNVGRTFFQQRQKLPLLSELCVYAVGHKVPRGTICDLRTRVPLHRCVQRMSKITGYDGWHRLSRTWSMPHGQMRAILRDSKLTKLHV